MKLLNIGGNNMVDFVVIVGIIFIVFILLNIDYNICVVGKTLDEIIRKLK